MTEQTTLDSNLQQLEEDLLAADFRWSILVAAACSYRHDSVLRPFPPMLLRNTDTNDQNENTSVNRANGLFADRDHAAMVSVHAAVVISRYFGNSTFNDNYQSYFLTTDLFYFPFIIYYHLGLLSLQLLNCVMSVLSLNSYWIGLDWWL